MQESFTFLVISIEPTISDLRVELSRKVRRIRKMVKNQKFDFSDSQKSMCKKNLA